MQRRLFADYISKLLTAANTVSEDSLNKMIETLRGARDSCIYIIGNGGSAAIASHFATDLFRAFEITNLSNRVVSLTDNTSLLTASGNDFGFETIFERQLSQLCREKDVLVAISSSGNSENIIRAVHAAKNEGLVSIGLSGFDGGQAKKIADINIHIDSNNYGVIEDCHQSIMHSMAQYLSKKR